MDYLQRSLIIKEEVSDKKGVGSALNNIGLVYTLEGDYPKALDYFQRSLKIFEEISAKRGLANTLNYIGIIYYNQGNYPKALEYFQMAIDVGHKVTENTEGLAEASYRMGDTEKAYALYMQLYKDGYRTFSLCNNLANLSVKKSEYGFAASLLSEALGRGVLDEENSERLRHNIAYLEQRALSMPPDS